MNETILQLTTRNSAPRLCEPAPDKVTLDYMMEAALRAPDHAWLQPWRFLVVRGESRDALGRVFEKALLAGNPEADEEARNKALAAPLRAPLMVVVVCRYTEHPKVPHQEQIISAGCAAHAMMLAAEAQGYAGIWRTGSYAEDPVVAEGLGLAANESIIGFLYFGTREGRAKPLPERPQDNFVEEWSP